MIQIIFATGNNAKLAQMRYVAEYFSWPVEVVGGRDLFGQKAAYEEIGETVEEVARNGALAVAKKVGVAVITEDTDFRVDALNGLPGIRANTFLKQFGRLEILNRLQDIHSRGAVIRSAVVFATPDGESQVFLNELKGTISEAEHFGNFPEWVAPSEGNMFGGGYNSIFIPNGHNRTLAEFSPEETILWSYRERNFLDVIQYIFNYEYRGKDQ